jgi:hypothetical protein
LLTAGSICAGELPGTACSPGSRPPLPAIACDAAQQNPIAAIVVNDQLGEEKFFDMKHPLPGTFGLSVAAYAFVVIGGSSRAGSPLRSANPTPLARWRRRRFHGILAGVDRLAELVARTAAAIRDVSR